MATKSDFTAEEWQILTWAVADAQRYVSVAHRGFLESFREAGAAEEFVDAVLLDPEAGLMRRAGRRCRHRARPGAQGPAQGGCRGGDRAPA